MKGCERFRAKNGETYFFINDLFIVQRDRDLYSDADDIRYEVGNYFETKDIAEVTLRSIKLEIFRGNVKDRLQPKF